jgi:hypothetical protein
MNNPRPKVAKEITRSVSVEIQQQLWHHQSYTLIRKDLKDKNPGTIHPLLDNLTALHITHYHIYNLQLTNAHDYLKTESST